MISSIRVMLLVTVCLLFMLSLSSFAYGQSPPSFSGQRLTLTPDYGYSAFVPGSYIRARGARIRAGFDETRDNLHFKYFVTALPSQTACYVFNVFDDSLSFVIPSNLSGGITGFTLRGPTFNETILIGDSGGQPAKLKLSTVGRVAHFRSTFFGDPFNGTIVFPDRIGIVIVTLQVSNVGSVRDWIVRAERADGSIIEVPATAFPRSSAVPFDTLNFQLPRGPDGPLRLTAIAVSDPSLMSDTVDLVSASVGGS